MVDSDLTQQVLYKAQANSIRLIMKQSLDWYLYCIKKSLFTWLYHVRLGIKMYE